eukprot:TRINITY_DN17379_c0_g1_i1.p1 TRINITY_DN17379_c0_g1~~TRINITY_DN17379_c0_g1_i1.p1  ORF type:complete len:622 (-),score=106.03 TRINITY_DN17379_c0_g1_i1:13-1848(-)
MESSDGNPLELLLNAYDHELIRLLQSIKDFAIAELNEDNVSRFGKLLHSESAKLNWENVKALLQLVQIWLARSENREPTSPLSTEAFIEDIILSYENLNKIDNVPFKRAFLNVVEDLANTFPHVKPHLGRGFLLDALKITKLESVVMSDRYYAANLVDRLLERCPENYELLPDILLEMKEIGDLIVRADEQFFQSALVPILFRLKNKAKKKTPSELKTILTGWRPIWIEEFSSIPPAAGFEHARRTFLNNLNNFNKKILPVMSNVKQNNKSLHPNIYVDFGANYVSIENVCTFEYSKILSSTLEGQILTLHLLKGVIQPTVDEEKDIIEITIAHPSDPKKIKALFEDRLKIHKIRKSDRNSTRKSLAAIKTHRKASKSPARNRSSVGPSTITVGDLSPMREDENTIPPWTETKKRPLESETTTTTSTRDTPLFSKRLRTNIVDPSIVDDEDSDISTVLKTLSSTLESKLNAGNNRIADRASLVMSELDNKLEISNLKCAKERDGFTREFKRKIQDLDKNLQEHIEKTHRIFEELRKQMGLFSQFEKFYEKIKDEFQTEIETLEKRHEIELETIEKQGLAEVQSLKAFAEKQTRNKKHIQEFVSRLSELEIL